MNEDDILKYVAPLVGLVVTTGVSAFVAWIVAKRTSSNTIFTVRATVRTGYRTRWLEEFRECAVEFLYLGQQVHSPLSGIPAATLDERRELRKRAAQMIVLLGQGTARKDGDPRPLLAEVVKSYALAPSAEEEAKLVELIRAVFRERWRQVTNETGQL